MAIGGDYLKAVKANDATQGANDKRKIFLHWSAGNRDGTNFTKDMDITLIFLLVVNQFVEQSLDKLEFLTTLMVEIKDHLQQLVFLVCLPLVREL